VEIGTYCGRSLLATCLGIKAENATVFSIDANCEYPIGNEWISAVRNATLAHIHTVTTVIKVRTLEMLSIDASRYCFERQLRFDSAFIDGDHNYAECRADIEAWSALLKSGGIISGHDYWPTHTGVMDAVNELLTGRFAVIPGTRIWVARI
jgi:predicted O-methyltransferase YrrM